MKPGLYRHFKGNPYRVYGICAHSETSEEFVRYKSLKYGTHWVRPVRMFAEHVDRGDYKGPDSFENLGISSCCSFGGASGRA